MARSSIIVTISVVGLFVFAGTGRALRLGQRLDHEQKMITNATHLEGDPISVAQEHQARSEVNRYTRARAAAPAMEETVALQETPAEKFHDKRHPYWKLGYITVGLVVLLASCICCCISASENHGEGEIDDEHASDLSYVGLAAYNALRRKHWYHWKEAWNVTSGKLVGEVRQTPHGTWHARGDPGKGHDDWFPEKLCQIISRTQKWVDVTSLGPPDGMFLEHFTKAIENVAATAKRTGNTITIRLLFGNIIGMPVNCHAVIKDLTKNIPADANIKLWVGAWRKGVSWNHSKIIAVDGIYLHNGGHNLWDYHYLKSNPVHDLSMEAEGSVAKDGHRFANKMWNFIEKNQKTLIGHLVAMLPDYMPTILATRVTVSEFPEGIPEFPPTWTTEHSILREKQHGDVPMISMGRFGSLYPFARPSDDAIVALINSAKTAVRMSLQDLGPICLPGTVIAVPGCVWPKEYLEALGRAIYDRGVDVEICLSNPGSIPGGLKPTEALYGNGWTCTDVAAEIIKAIISHEGLDLHNAEHNNKLRKMILQNLRICVLHQKQGNQWQNQGTMGNHAKHFIIDDRCYYIGSQNLYIADLAEWGILVDDEAQTKKCMAEYWNPMWKESFAVNRDLNVEDVMAGLGVDRNGEDPRHASAETKALAAQAERCSCLKSHSNTHHHDE